MVLNIPGITRFISFDGKPATVSDEEIDTIKLLINGDWDITKESSYGVGDKVKVIHGPLSGLEGVLLEKKGTKRFGIRLESIEQSISIEIQSRFLERI
jgi:transcription antitermination factor NusG